MYMQLFEKDTLLAEVEFDPVAEKVSKYITHTDDIWKLPFGACMSPDYEWVVSFLESRCPSRERLDLKEVLGSLGLDVFDPLAIVQTTHGVMWNDYFWVKFDDEDLSYDSVKIRID